MAVSKIRSSDTSTIARCDGVMSKIHFANRTVNHSSESEGNGTDERCQSWPAIVVRKHSPKASCDNCEMAMKEMTYTP